MKKGVVLLFLILSIALVSSEACDLDVTLLNQDPYPAVPGDYVKLVFQIEGLDSPDCNDITFTLLQDYPLELDPGESETRTFKKIDYIKDYESNLLIPYDVRIDEDALDGTIPVEVVVQSKGDVSVAQTLNIEISDVKAGFEIYVKDYSYATRELTLEVLNIAKSDVEALTIEIPKQDIIQIKGSNRIVVGDLDSNEYTTTDFEAIPTDGEFKVDLIYSDTINTRRTVEKTVSFDSSYFTNRVADQKTTSITTYVIWTAIIGLLAWWIIKKVKKKKR